MDSGRTWPTVTPGRLTVPVSRYRTVGHPASGGNWPEMAGDAARPAHSGWPLTSRRPSWAVVARPGAICDVTLLLHAGIPCRSCRRALNIELAPASTRWSYIRRRYRSRWCINAHYPHMPIGKVWIYRLLFVCFLCICCGYLRRQ